MRLSLLLGLVAAAALSVQGASWIVPGTAWYDTDGKKIDAHGGGVVRRGDVFYWIGFSARGKTGLSLQDA